jgi:hypothetical protein
MKPTPAQAKILQALKDGQTIRRILILRNGLSFYYWLPTVQQPDYQLRKATMNILLNQGWIEFYEDEHGWALLRITRLGLDMLKG